MADTTTDTQSQPTYLEMSDEDILNASFPEDVDATTSATEDATGAGNDTVTGDDVTDPATTTDPVTTDDAGGTTGEVTGTTEGVEDGKEKPTSQGTEVPTTEDPKTGQTEDTSSAVNFEAEYKRLLAPFKANGREIAIKNVDDAIALMQMGANYNKKMAAIKPNLKLMKLLENNGLLSEEKIGFLIDLEKKNPEAISKLVKDSGVDPMDLDAEKASEYKQTTYTVDDRELELDTVLSEIEDTPTYNRTLNIVSTQWDASSKQVIASKPEILKVINTHVERGIYDIIVKEIENERMFGRLNGMSDLDAYRQVGDAIQARGGFNHLNAGSSQVQGQVPAAGAVVAPKPKKVEDDDLKNKRRAASSTKPAVAAADNKAFNPLNLSDDAFSKLVNEKFL